MEYPTGSTKFILVATAISCAILELIDSTIVNVSLREISGSIGATATEISWVITAYSIANVIIIPLSGMLSNLFGRNAYFSGSVILFTFASLMCGMSSSLPMLVAWRFIQGLGGGGLLSTAQSIIMDAYPPEKRTSGLIVFGLGVILGPSFGPVLGGYITDHISWHWIFFVNLPLGITAAILSRRYVPNLQGVAKPIMDWIGIGLLAVGIGSLQYVLEEGAGKDWFDSSEILWFTVTATLFLAAFVVRELSTEHPAVNLRLYKNFNLLMGNGMNFLAGVILNGTMFSFPLFAQLSLGWTATQTGLFILPGALSAIPAMIVVKILQDKLQLNPKIIILIGLLMTAIPLVIFSFSSADSNGAQFFWPFMVRGFGALFMIMPVLGLATAGLSGKNLAQAVGLSNMLRQLGGAVGVALMGVYVNRESAYVRNGLIGRISDFNPISTERMGAIGSKFQSMGYSSDEAMGAAQRLMDGAVSSQSLLISYNHSFMVAALGVLLCIPIVLSIRYHKSLSVPEIDPSH